MTPALTYDELAFPVYVNSHSVGAVGGVNLTVSDAINAAQLVRNNVFLGGKKGTGKTQLLTDMYCHRYGQKGKLLEGRPDLKADEIYKTFNLQKLREGALTSDELIELTQSIHLPYIGVDEINRAPEVSQNELLSIMNGYILHKGEKKVLGDGFSVGVSTGNLGNGGYVGTFKIDDALADRLHLFLDLDYWKPTDEDMARIDMRMEIDPRVVDSSVRDITDKIKAAHQEINRQETPLEITIIGRYLERGLDYCVKYPSAENSKDNLKEAWPVICTQKSCDLRNTVCGRVKAVGERTVKAAKRLAKGLQYVAELKNSDAAADPIGAMMTAVRLMLPASGVISPAYLREEGNFNNANIAAQHLVQALENEVKAQFYGTGSAGPLTVALAYAGRGKLSEHPYQLLKPEWRFVESLLAQLNDKNK